MTRETSHVGQSLPRAGPARFAGLAPSCRRRLKESSRCSMVVMREKYLQRTTIDEALELLAKNREEARVINGGTHLLIEMERKVRSSRVMIDVSRGTGLDETRLVQGAIHLGAGVTYNQVVASPLLRERAFPFVRACCDVGAPQVRNRGTLAGNVITASPANDTITPVSAMGARVTLASKARGQRQIPLHEFIRGVRETALAADTFIKLALRRGQAISRGLDEATIGIAADLATHAARPIDDVRGTAQYRREMVKVLTARALRQLREVADGESHVADAVKPWGKSNGRFRMAPRQSGDSDIIQTTVNGRLYDVRGAGARTLLQMLRDDIGLTGTKEGCAEGECGACTVLLDGIAVLGCPVPAPRAQYADIVTIEDVKQEDRLHPVQRSFVEAGPPAQLDKEASS